MVAKIAGPGQRNSGISDTRTPLKNSYHEYLKPKKVDYLLSVSSFHCQADIPATQRSIPRPYRKYSLLSYRASLYIFESYLSRTTDYLFIPTTYHQCDTPDPSHWPSRTTPGIELTAAWAPANLQTPGSALWRVVW
jgi:hypothetical protein